MSFINNIWLQDLKARSLPAHAVIECVPCTFIGNTAPLLLHESTFTANCTSNILVEKEEWLFSLIIKDENEILFTFPLHAKPWGTEHVFGLLHQAFAISIQSFVVINPCRLRANVTSCTLILLTKSTQTVPSNLQNNTKQILTKCPDTLSCVICKDWKDNSRRIRKVVASETSKIAVFSSLAVCANCSELVQSFGSAATIYLRSPYTTFVGTSPFSSLYQNLQLSQSFQELHRRWYLPQECMEKETWAPTVVIHVVQEM